MAVVVTARKRTKDAMSAMAQVCIPIPSSTNGDVLAVANDVQFVGVAVFKHFRSGSGDNDELAVDMRVRVYPGTQTESRGVIIEDFGEMAGHGVDLGGQHFADPARRWAVRVDSGDLVFADTDQLVAE